MRDERVPGRYTATTGCQELSRRGRIAPTSVAAIFMLAIAGCGAVTAPASTGGSPGTLCIPAAAGVEVAVAEVLTAHAPITLELIELDSATNVSMLGAYVVPITNQVSLGSFTLDGEVPDAWSLRKDLPGYVAEAGSVIDVVIIVERETSDDSRIGSVRVGYTADGVRLFTSSTTSIEIKDSCYT